VRADSDFLQDRPNLIDESRFSLDDAEEADEQGSGRRGSPLTHGFGGGL
jgi:hypothetical protein